MHSIPFTKMHGLGNSYIYLDALSNQFPMDQLHLLAQQVSSQATGIGSDGLILIAPSTSADVKMRIFNKDGSEAKNCGNGLRCVAAYCFQKGLIQGKELTIETLGGIVKAEIQKTIGQTTWVLVNMGKPRLKRGEIPMRGPSEENVLSEPFVIQGHSLNLTALSMGNPHALFFVPDKEENHNLHLTLGPMIEKDNRFPEGVNVEFITQEQEHTFRCRVWERGSGATQACGTGACATAVAAILNGLAPYDTPITVKLDGGSLEIKWEKKGNLSMTGPAEMIASGTLFMHA